MPAAIVSDSKMFANDQTVFEIDYSLDSALTRLQTSVQQLQNYTSSNSCKIVIIARSPFIGPLPDIINKWEKHQLC